VWASNFLFWPIGLYISSRGGAPHVALQQREAAVGDSSSRGWRAVARPEEGSERRLKQRRQPTAVEAVVGAALFNVHPLLLRW
jgi:hypothetical protein